ncbi:MAG TPA: response regulator transcription factor [Acidimicrobiales bacterium]|nr:response regulator transcription factor [Acidimicrobiales bacterium]
MSSRITVLVADSQRLFAEGVAVSLSREPTLDVLHEFHVTGLEALAAISRLRPQVVFYDYWMVGVNGPAATRAIHVSAPQTKVILLSWFHGQRHVQEALEAGAVGFLPKSVRVDQVVEAAHRAAAGDPLIYGDELLRMVESIETRADEDDARWSVLSTLTVRQLEILQLLALGPPTKQMARELNITVGTLKNHISGMLIKTGARSQLELVNMARNAGLVRDVAPHRGTSPPRHNS